jgi:hypothetical protein
MNNSYAHKFDNTDEMYKVRKRLGKEIVIPIWYTYGPTTYIPILLIDLIMSLQYSFPSITEVSLKLGYRWLLW